MTPVRSPTLGHQADAVDRLERTDQDRRRMPLSFSDSVHEIVNAVVQIDVGKTRRSVKRRVAARWPGRRMARGIVLANIGRGLNARPGGGAITRPKVGPRRSDRPGADASSGTVDENLAEELFGNDQSRPLVELPGKHAGSAARHPAYMLVHNAGSAARHPAYMLAGPRRA